MSERREHTKGKITEKLGQWTNDRDTEALGRAEQKTDEPSEELVDAERDAVRREHGDISDPADR